MTCTLAKLGMMQYEHVCTEPIAAIPRQHPQVKPARMDLEEEHEAPTTIAC